MTCTTKIASLAIVCAAIGAVAVGGPLRTRHPDGASAAYRGWGPTTLSQDGYTCTLYNSDGSEAGEIHFGFFNGAVDLVLGGREAHFTNEGSATLGFGPLDEAAFPSLAGVPDQFKTAAHSMLTVAGRGEIGVNARIAEPVTPLARSVRVVEIRCVYIVDGYGVPVWCLNCLFEVTTTG